jgi:hypothetical protein
MYWYGSVDELPKGDVAIKLEQSALVPLRPWPPPPGGGVFRNHIKAIMRPAPEMHEALFHAHLNAATHAACCVAPPSPGPGYAAYHLLARTTGRERCLRKLLLPGEIPASWHSARSSLGQERGGEGSFRGGIPAEWHAWLHYTSDTPIPHTGKQKPHLPTPPARRRPGTLSRRSSSRRRRRL